MKTLIQEYLADTAKALTENINIPDIEKVIGILHSSGGKIFTCGNGGSASTASHFACDLVKMGAEAICLNDNLALMTAITNDNGFNALYLEQLRNQVWPGDVLICFSVHGGVGKDKAGWWSRNLLEAINFMQKSGGIAIGIVGCEGGIIRRIADASIKVNVFSTPIIESVHLAIAHLICECLKEKNDLGSKTNKDV